MEQTQEFSYWVPIAAVATWCAVLIGINVVSYLFSPSWRKMYRSYASKNKPHGQALRWQEMEVGLLYGNIYKFHIAPHALFISSCFPFSCWSPVFEIPWREVKINKEVYLFFKWGYQVEFGSQGAKANFTQKSVKKWVPHVTLPQ